MSAVEYQYSLATDFVGSAGKLSSDGLVNSVAASAITAALDRIDTVGDTVSVWFKAALSGGDETILDALVAAHDGVDPAPELQKVETLIAPEGFLARLRCIGFLTASSAADKLRNKGANAQDIGDVTYRLLDAQGVVTTTPGDACATELDFEPTYTERISGGWIVTPADLDGGSSDAWWLSAVGAPDIPEQYGGSILFLQPANLEQTGGAKITFDGKMPAPIEYNATDHRGRIRFRLTHPAGVSKRFQLFLMTFR